MLSFDDITKNLSSLQFDSALPDEERRALIQLRQKSLAAISTACAQAVYVVKILREVNEIIFEKSSAASKSCISSGYSGLKIGIIGAGRLGKQLASVILDSGVVNATCLYISTRCPENLEEFQSKGVFCCFDNVMVSQTADILFLCCLPSQFNTVSKDLQDNIFGVVYSFVSGISLQRISRLLNYRNIIKPNLIFKSDINQTFDESSPWTFGRDVPEILADPKCLLHTCPLYYDEKSLLETDVKLCESFIILVLNKCTKHGIERNDAVRICNSVMFGLSREQSSYLDVENILLKEPSLDRKKHVKLFPVFNMVQVVFEETLLGKKVVEDDVLRNAFIEKYQKILVVR